MMPTAVDLAALARAVGSYRIGDRALRASLDRIRAHVERGETPSERDLETFVRDARRYFAGLEREARAQIKDLDRRLDDLFQQQYNLQAERGVAHRRLLGATETLERLQQVELGES
ncbi:MAG TPA: hypothetical protein VNJ51_02125 [Candidatus Dormibacteraeota bacterium]|nr:hypothetical protein [Candidatus Dormibacteraeota bacterium]